MNYELRIKKQKEKGFTLVETLVAVAILSMAILGLLSVLASGIIDTTYAKNKIIAGYLAQEGIEYVRNMRDTYVLYDATSAQNGWNSFNTKLTSASCQAVNGCYFNASSLSYSVPSSKAMTNISILPCSSGSCPYLLYDTTNGKYGYASGTTSSFIRKIRISQILPDETEIFSTISWNQGSGIYSITLSENLYNWVQ